MNILCSECSHGSPDAGHRHQRPSILGLAGHEDDVAQCLAARTADRPGVAVLALDLIW